jgi:hypothetical protein
MNDSCVSRYSKSIEHFACLGKHNLSISWSEVPIPRSPLNALAVPLESANSSDIAVSPVSCVDIVHYGDSDEICPQKVLVLAASSAEPGDVHPLRDNQQFQMMQQMTATETRAQQNIEFVIDGSHGAGPGTVKGTCMWCDA